MSRSRRPVSSSPAIPDTWATAFLEAARASSRVSASASCFSMSRRSAVSSARGMGTSSPRSQMVRISGRTSSGASITCCGDLYRPSRIHPDEIQATSDRQECDDDRVVNFSGLPEILETIYTDPVRTDRWLEYNAPARVTSAPGFFQLPGWHGGGDGGPWYCQKKV